MKKKPILRLNYAGSTILIPLIIGSMVFLACLSLSGGLAIDYFIKKWSHSLSGTFTIQVPTENKEGKSSLNKKIKLIEKELATIQEIKKIKVISKKESEKLLKPWFGKNSSLLNIRIPILIDIKLKYGKSIETENLEKKLNNFIPGTTITKNIHFIEKSLSIAKIVQAISFFVIVIIIFSGISIIVLVTHNGLSMHTEEVKLLHLVGAHDSYISKFFFFNTFFLSFIGGLVGLVVSFLLITICFIFFFKSFLDTLPLLKILLLKYTIILFLPLLAAGISSLTSYITVSKYLKRLH